MKILKGFKLAAILICVGAIVLGGVSSGQTAGQKAIVVVSFGTTFDDTRLHCIDSVENKIQQNFPEYEVRRAFTSNIVMKRLAERGIQTDTLVQALDKLKAEGYREVVVQSTHLTPGEEFHNKILTVTARYQQQFDKISVGRPVLTFDGANGQPNDFAIAVQALKTQMPLDVRGQAVVFMGHGSPNQPNLAYPALQQQLDIDGVEALVGVVEETDHPSLEEVQALLKARNIKKVVLMPLMLVAGDHASNDMAGDEDDSWKSILTADGIEVAVYLHGLGENGAFQDIYVAHVRDAIKGL